MRHDRVRRWVPELRDVPLERLAEPWAMTGAEQAAAGCVIGRDHPAPIVDHRQERERAMGATGPFAAAKPHRMSVQLQRWTGV